MMPFVSVIVTTYNQAAYIEEALRSACEQTYPHKEVIVVDDGSSDETPDRIRAFSDRVIYLCQRNQGIAASRNAGIRRASGDLIAFLDGDDVWEPEKLAVQVAAVERHPDSGLIVVDGVQFSEAGVLQEWLIGTPGREWLGRGESAIVATRCYAALAQGCFISTMSQVMVPRRVLDTVGLSDPRFKLCSDYDLYMRIAARYEVTFVGRRLVRWRYTPTSASGPEEVRRLRWLEDSIPVWQKQLREASSAEDRAVVQQALAAGARKAAQGGYYYGRAVDRWWTTAYLVRILRKSRMPRTVVPFLMGLWLPHAVTSRIGPMVRRRVR